MADSFNNCDGLFEAPPLFLSVQIPTHVASSDMGGWRIAARCWWAIP
jgi:hypothetical protein